MLIFRYTIRLFVLFFLLGFQVGAQELPPIIKYTPTTYAAGNQNWMVAQDKNHFVFFANNEGLLEFNGSSWSIYPSPNETIIRSVKVIDDKIYTGCYMEFGYWKRQTNGQLKYKSLSQTIKNKILDDEQFWNILSYDQWVIFQSLNRIYIYDSKTGKFNIITPESSIIKSFRTASAIYFQCFNNGLYELENGNSKLVSDNPILKANRIVGISSIDEGVLIETQKNGFFKLINGTLVKFNTEADSEIQAGNIYSSQLLSDGGFAVGTVSNGLFILSKEGNIRYHITQNRGLSNNTVLSLFEDVDKNLWIGLDNGINCINLQSPVKSYTDDSGILGTVYTSLAHNNLLYVGTNQGLFYKNLNVNEPLKFIQGTKGQVWSLFEHNGTLFCGHDSGTFIVENTSANLLFAHSGTWKFEVLPHNPNIIIQGNYYGISFLEKINNQWVFKNRLAGFDYSSKYFELSSAKQIIVSHEYKGVFALQIDNKLQRVVKCTPFTNPKKGKNACLTKFNNVIYYACKEGIFNFNTKINQFEKDKNLSPLFEKDEYTSGKMIVDKSNKLWVFTKNYIHYFTVSKLDNQLKQNNISIPSTLTNTISGYENVTQLSSSEYLIGTTDGYYAININDLSFKNFNVSLTKISANKLNKEIKNYNLLSGTAFAYDENNIAFNYTVPEYNKYIYAEYQYLLEGVSDKWSEWSSKSSVNFKNLSPGDYVFKVRAKIANSTPENTINYAFTISKPWYATYFAIFIYILICMVIAHFINRAYKNYYQHQREKLIEENNLLLEIKELENEQKLMKLKNEQLVQDVDLKNKELAVSTMSLIKKDELLALIKEDLKKSSDEGNKTSIKSVITTINRNINQEDSWNLFKEAFDNADKDFLKKVKVAHPALTPNDLRLCAYLRLNLSSKEIAPLLNISVRSIEIKRYRLRKKMDLPHEQGLVEYILSI